MWCAEIPKKLQLFTGWKPMTQKHGKILFLHERLAQLIANRNIEYKWLSKKIGRERHFIGCVLGDKGVKPRTPRFENFKAIAKELRVPIEAFAPELKPGWTIISRLEKDRFIDILPEIRTAKNCITLHRLLPSSLVPRKCVESKEFRAALITQWMDEGLVDAYLKDLHTRVGKSIIPNTCRHFIISDRRFFDGLSQDWLETVIPHALKVHENRAMAAGFLAGSDFDNTRNQIGRITNYLPERLSIFDDMLAVIRSGWDHYSFTYHPQTVAELKELLEAAANLTNIPLPLDATKREQFHEHNQRVLVRFSSRPNKPR